MTDHPPTHLRVIRLLLSVFPKTFRVRFGESMEYSLSSEYREARRSGFMTVCLFWIRCVASLTVHGLLERLTHRSAGKAAPAGDENRKGWNAPALSDLLGEFRLATRRLYQSPGFSMTALVTMGLGIGATTAIFSVVHAVLLRPLPYHDSDNVVLVGHQSRSGVLGIPSAGWFHYRERSRTLADLAVYIESSSSIAGTGEPLELGVIQATPSLLRVLGVTPALGRDLTEEDAMPGAPSVVLVSHGFWVTHLGSDTAAIGKPVLEGARQLVAGVLPAGFTFERPPATVVFGNPFKTPDIIAPLRGLDRSKARFGNFMYQGVARLAAGVSPEDAVRELQHLMLEAAATYSAEGGFTPGELEEGGYTPRVVRFQDAIVGELADVLWILFGAVGFVLLIAVANVANLFLVRAEGRHTELSIRRALGATRWVVARSYLQESVILGTLGGIAGIGLAGLGTKALLRLAPSDIPRAEGVGMDLAVVAFGLGLALLAGIVFGIAPVLRKQWFEAGGIQDRSRGGTASVRASRTRNALVVAQVAFATILLIGSGLLLRTFKNLRDVDPGFDGSHTVTLKLALSRSLLRSAGHDEAAADAARSRFMGDLARRLAEIPGVESATYAADLPLDGGEFYDFIAVDGELPAGLEAGTKTLRVFIGPGYLKAIGARLSAGRELEDWEFADQPRSVVVNRAFARSRFGDGEAIGRRVMQWYAGADPTADVWYTIVGVVEDIRETSLMTPAVPTVYLPTIFLPEGGFGMWISNMTAVVRVSGDPRAVLPRILAEVRTAYPEFPINSVATLDQVTAHSFQRISFAMVIILIAAILALVLGLVGIYGTVSYVVGQRRREFGVRIALGATGWDVRRQVLTGATVMGLTGLGLGLGAAGLASGVIRSMLFGVTAVDPLVYGGVAAGLFLMVLAASLGPAGRAASADPAEAMQVE